MNSSILRDHAVQRKVVLATLFIAALFALTIAVRASFAVSPSSSSDQGNGHHHCHPTPPGLDEDHDFDQLPPGHDSDHDFDACENDFR